MVIILDTIRTFARQACRNLKIWGEGRVFESMYVGLNNEVNLASPIKSRKIISTFLYSEWWME